MATNRDRERAHARKEKKRFEIYTIDIEQHYNRYIYIMSECALQNEWERHIEEIIGIWNLTSQIEQ